MADSNYELPNMANSGEEQMDEDAMDELIGLQPESKKRRLSVEQVRSLERSFEMETKLEPEKKLKLAQDLGLQPRQVAVWFQNRRARWKTKQLERDYSVLKSSYDALRSDYEDLEHEKKLLLAELETLKGKLEEETRDEGHSNLVASVKEESIIDSGREIVGGGERSIKGLSDYAVFVKEEQPCIDMNLKPLRVVVVKESEESFSPGSDSSAELVNEDKASFNPFMQAAPSSIKCISPWDSIANNDQNQGCMYLAEGIHTISLPTKAYQQLFKSEEGYIHEEVCNQYIDDLEHDEDVASGANITWWDY